MIHTKLTDYLCEDCGLPASSVRATLALFAEGACNTPSNRIINSEFFF